MEELTITLTTRAEIKGMDQLLEFFLQCDAREVPRYKDATKIAREIREHIKKNDDPPPG
jgi:hypothetical protein